MKGRREAYLHVHRAMTDAILLLLLLPAPAPVDMAGVGFDRPTAAKR